LGVLGYCLTRTGFLTPLWQDLELPLKTVAYTPGEKLLAVLVSILTGCRAVAQANTRLRPDVALAQAWGQARFAEQSTLARTLDAFTPWQVAQLRAGSDSLFRRESRLLHHDFDHAWLWLDIDLTPFTDLAPGGSQHERQVREKNDYGRQLARVEAPQYHETVFSRLYPGTQDSGPTYMPILDTLETVCCSARPRSNTRCCAQMRASAAMPMSTMR